MENSFWNYLTFSIHIYLKNTLNAKTFFWFVYLTYISWFIPCSSLQKHFIDFTTNSKTLPSLSWVCPIQREIINTALFVSIDQLFDNIILKCKVVVQTFIVDTMSWIDSEAEFSIWHTSVFTRFWWNMETTTVLRWKKHISWKCRGIEF